MNYVICPCCSNKLIHHISNHRDYWFCRSCWQEMPAIEMEIVNKMEYFNRQPKSLTNLIKSKPTIFNPV